MGRHPSVRGQPPCRNGQRPASGDHADADQEPQTACNTAHVTLASGATDAGRMRRHATMPPARPPRRPAIEVGGFNSGILARMGGTFGRACPWPPGRRIGAALSCGSWDPEASREARGCPCPSPDTPCGHPALRSLDADFTPPSLAPLVDNAGSRARATPRSIIPRIESGRASSRPAAVPRRRARFTQNPDQAVLAVAPPRTGRSSPEKACCSQSTIGEAM